MSTIEPDAPLSDKKRVTVLFLDHSLTMENSIPFASRFTQMGLSSAPGYLDDRILGNSIQIAEESNTILVCVLLIKDIPTFAEAIARMSHPVRFIVLQTAEDEPLPKILSNSVIQSTGGDEKIIAAIKAVAALPVENTHNWSRTPRSQFASKVNG